MLSTLFALSFSQAINLAKNLVYFGNYSVADLLKLAKDLLHILDKEACPLVAICGAGDCKFHNSFASNSKAADDCGDANNTCNMMMTTMSKRSSIPMLSTKAAAASAPATAQAADKRWPNENSIDEIKLKIVDILEVGDTYI